MAVIMQMEWPGLTEEQFNEARRRINWQGDSPKGSIVQAQGWYNGTFRACDVWESEEDWNNFLNNRVFPNIQDLNFPGEPTIQIYPVSSLHIPTRQTAPV